MMHRLLSRHGGLIAALIAVAAVAAQFGWVSAAPATGPSPATTNPMTFSASPVDNLADGTSITYEVTTSGGTHLIGSLIAHICKHGLAGWNQNNFGYSGSTATRCVYDTGSPGPPGIVSGGLTNSNYEVSNTYSGAESDSGPLTFLAGSGSVGWINATGQGSSLQCDSTHSCDLVVEVNLTDVAVPTTFFVQPLTFLGTGTTTTTTTTPDATTTTGGSGSTTSTTTSPATTTTHAATTTTTSTTTTTVPVTTTTHATTTTTTSPATTTTHATTTTTSNTTTTLPGSTTTTTAGSATVEPSTVGPAGTISISSSGWKAGTDVSVTLHSDPVILGSLHADGNGNVSGQFTVPVGTPAGAHTVELAGSDPQNALRTVTVALTVSGTATAGTVSATPTGTSTGPTSTLAFTGSPTRTLVSIALLLIAVGLFALGQRYRSREVSAS